MISINKSKSKKILWTLLFAVMIIIFVFNLIKTVNYTKSFKIDNSHLKILKLKSVISDVAISRKLEIKINGIKDWQRVGGSGLQLDTNQKEPEDYFLKGDSI